MPLPAEYTYTELGMWFRLCARYGQDPMRWPDTVDDATFSHLCAMETVFEQEAANRAATISHQRP